MKKIITPILYTAFLFPLTAIAVGIEMLTRASGIIGEWKGVIDTPLIITFTSTIIIFGIPIFWLANMLIQKIEKPGKVQLSDHLRQSALFYILGIYNLSSWVSHGFTNTEEDGYLLLWIGISLIAIIINYRFQKKHA